MSVKVLCQSVDCGPQWSCLCSDNDDCNDNDNDCQLTVVLSGPRSCLCSELEECEVTADNELDIVPQVSQVENISEILC